MITFTMTMSAGWMGGWMMDEGKYYDHDNFDDPCHDNLEDHGNVG